MKQQGSDCRADRGRHALSGSEVRFPISTLPVFHWNGRECGKFRDHLQKATDSATMDHTRDCLRHFEQKFDNGITLDNLRLVESYVKQEIHFLFHLRMRNAKEFIAHLQRRGVVEGNENTTKIDGLGGRMAAPENLLQLGPSAWSDAVRHLGRTRREQETVLVDLV